MAEADYEKRPVEFIQRIANEMGMYQEVTGKVLHGYRNTLLSERNEPGFTQGTVRLPLPELERGTDDILLGIEWLLEFDEKEPIPNPTGMRPQGVVYHTSIDNYEQRRLPWLIMAFDLKEERVANVYVNPHLKLYKRLEELEGESLEFGVQELFSAIYQRYGMDRKGSHLKLL
jgi:hypothetical protein